MTLPVSLNSRIHNKILMHEGIAPKHINITVLPHVMLCPSDGLFRNKNKLLQFSVPHCTSPLCINPF